MAQFTQRLIDHIKEFEGGYANNPNDRGGETMKGITWPTYVNLVYRVLGRTSSKSHFLSLTDEEVSKFMHWYFRESGADRFRNQSVAEYFADFFWGTGYFAIKLLQRLLNVSDDGKMGPITLAAVNRRNGQSLLADLHTVRLAQYNRLAKDPSQVGHLRGWLRRANTQYEALKKKAPEPNGGSGQLA